MAAADEPDFAPALVKSVEKLLGMHPGNTEDHLDSMLDQRIDDCLRCGYGLSHLKILARFLERRDEGNCGVEAVRIASIDAALPLHTMCSGEKQSTVGAKRRSVDD
jgi:hypothetical protein